MGTSVRAQEPARARWVAWAVALAVLLTVSGRVLSARSEALAGYEKVAAGMTREQVADALRGAGRPRVALGLGGGGAWEFWDLGDHRIAVEYRDGVVHEATMTPLPGTLSYGLMTLWESVAPRGRIALSL
jgi:hypothetical protein